MTYQEIYDSVVALTNRPDLQQELTVAIQAATLRMHQSDYYVRDIAEAKITTDETGYLHQINVKDVFERFRAISYLRKWNPEGLDPFTSQMTGAPGEYLEKIDPTAVLDSYGYSRENCYYVAGNILNIRSKALVSELLVGWYQVPKVSPIEQYSSWIADTVPHAIIFDACSFIFQTVGFQEQSRKYDTLVAEQLRLVQMAGLTGTGM